MNIFPRVLKAAFGLTILVLLAGGVWLYRSQEHLLRHAAEAELQAIAQLKVEQIVAWRKARVSDAAVIMESPFFTKAIGAWMADPQAGDAENIITRFHSIQKNYSYMDVLLVDPAGKVRLSLSGRPGALHAEAARVLTEAFTGHHPVFTDLHEGPADLLPHIDAITPLFVKCGEATNPLGAVILQIDPRQSLYPIINSWPTPKSTAETLLVRRDNDSVLYLNELSHQADTALRLRIPLSEEDIPAVMAVKGKEGLVQGKDYNGGPVLAVLAHIPDSPWFIVVKVDAKEAFAVWRSQAILIWALFLGVAGFVAAGVNMAWQRHAKAHYMALLKEETARRKSEERYKLLFENNLDGICLTDAGTGIIIDCNQALAALVDRDRAELIGQSQNILHPPSDGRTNFSPTFEQHLTGKEGTALETHVITSAGVIREVEIAASRLNLEGREILQGIFRDITERKQAEEARRAASLYSYTRSLIETSLDPLVTISAEGKITDVNTATEKITGLSRERLIGSDFADYFTEPEMARAGYQKVFEQGQVIDFPLAVRHASGAITEVIYNASVYRNEQGEVLGVFAAARDITERKRAEAEKAEREAQDRQLQKAKSLGRMAGAIAHHFNNQLQSVMGNLELAMEDLSQDKNPIKFLTGAIAAAHRASEVSGLMLTYLGQTADKQEPVNLLETCRQGLPMLRTAIPKDVALNVVLPSPGPVIVANANHIHQVLTNLLNNAWEAMGDRQGAIHLTVKTVSQADIPNVHRFPIGWRPQDSAYACLEVADEGCGIANIEEIFDPFFSSKFAGRGLGLAVVLGIVRAHQGVVTVESEPDRGSVFRVFFPISSKEVSRQPEKAAEAPKMEGGGTVLVVDDEEPIRTMAGVMLTRMGFAVLEAKDGLDAVEVFRQHKDEIRCVLCDLTMPGMDGWETLSALRKLSPNIYFILSSGYDKAQVMGGDHPEMPQAFLGKPYRFNNLSDVMRRAMSKLPAKLLVSAIGKENEKNRRKLPTHNG